jgi:hypothetical protein
MAAKIPDDENAKAAGDNSAASRKTHQSQSTKTPTAKELLKQIPKKTFYPFWVDYSVSGHLRTRCYQASDPGNAQAKCLAEHPKATIIRSYRTSDNPKEPAICVYAAASAIKITAEPEPRVTQDEFGFTKSLSFSERNGPPLRHGELQP